MQPRTATGERKETPKPPPEMPCRPPRIQMERMEERNRLHQHLEGGGLQRGNVDHAEGGGCGHSEAHSSHLQPFCSHFISGAALKPHEKLSALGYKSQGRQNQAAEGSTEGTEVNFSSAGWIFLQCCKPSEGENEKCGTALLCLSSPLLAELFLHSPRSRELLP